MKTKVEVLFMENFEFYNPTKILFGLVGIEKLSDKPHVNVLG
jgi:alcohol dehydrogenase YqhD (iron-dependent ADH family)